MEIYSHIETHSHRTRTARSHFTSGNLLSYWNALAPHSHCTLTFYKWKSTLIITHSDPSEWSRRREEIKEKEAGREENKEGFGVFHSFFKRSNSGISEEDEGEARKGVAEKRWGGYVRVFRLPFPKSVRGCKVIFLTSTTRNLDMERSTSGRWQSSLSFEWRPALTASKGKMHAHRMLCLLRKSVRGSKRAREKRWKQRSVLAWNAVSEDFEEAEKYCVLLGTLKHDQMRGFLFNPVLFQNLQKS